MDPSTHFGQGYLLDFFLFFFFSFKLILQIGKTKIFLRAGQMAELDARRAEILSSAAKTIQRRIRTHIARRRFIALREATIVLQSLCRGEPSKFFIPKKSGLISTYRTYLLNLLFFFFGSMPQSFRASVEQYINFHS